MKYQYSIIKGDIHKLVRLPKHNWCFPWRIPAEKKGWYWVPVPDELRDETSNDPICPKCRQKHVRSLQKSNY